MHVNATKWSASGLFVNHLLHFNMRSCDFASISLSAPHIHIVPFRQDSDVVGSIQLDA